jgi:hypothetical protein
VTLVWWLVASALLTLTWNKVLREFRTVKALRFTQALMIVATLIAFVAPLIALKRGGCRHQSSGVAEMENPEDRPQRDMMPPRMPPIPTTEARPMPSNEMMGRTMPPRPPMMPAPVPPSRPKGAGK